MSILYVFETPIDPSCEGKIVGETEHIRQSFQHVFETLVRYEEVEGKPDQYLPLTGLAILPAAVRALIHHHKGVDAPRSESISEVKDTIARTSVVSAGSCPIGITTNDMIPCVLIYDATLAEAYILAFLIKQNLEIKTQCIQVSSQNIRTTVS